MLFIEQINTHRNHFDDYFLFKDSAVLKNVHMSKLLLYIHFHTKPNDMSTIKAILVTFDTFRAAFF